jgi:rare lipoprotein A
MAPRRGSRGPGGPSNLLASFFLVLGCLTVLGVTFALGVTAGRRWPMGLPLPGLGAAPVVAARTERETPKRPEGRALDKDKPRPITEAPPVLTYYRDLTAPLGSPTAHVGSPGVAPAAPAPPRSDAAREVVKVAPRSDGRFTVQVGAFTVRTQAEALRARLTDGAYVSEVETGGVMHYRVRVGDFATREAADQAASRLRTERRLTAYVTTR